MQGIIGHNSYQDSLHNAYRSDHKQEHDLSCAQTQKQLCIFSKKLENCFHWYKVLQGQITFPIHSWHYQEAIPIKINPPRARNWYIEVKLSQTFLIIVFQYTYIFYTFWIWIYTNINSLKLLMYFNWVNIACMRSCHGNFLGFQELEIRDFFMRKN